MSVNVELLRPDLDGVAARLLSDAFLDDPAMLAIGPADPDRRWRWLHVVHRADLRIARRWGGPIHAAVDGDRVLGVSVVWDEGRYPPPRRSFLLFLPSAVQTPPPTMLRGLPVLSLMEKHHVKDPHVYLGILGVQPLQQRRGAGRALLGRLTADADRRGLPVYLETTKAENVPYYEGFGFKVTDEAPLRADARMWFMLRPPA